MDRTSYRLAGPPGTLVWRDWDDGCVIFSRATGETHYLDTFTSYLLRLIEAEPNTADGLTDAVCAGLASERTTVLETRIAQALRNFETLSLLERAP
jgi:PqqD family protein of HPr-rel-A system